MPKVVQNASSSSSLTPFQDDCSPVAQAFRSAAMDAKSLLDTTLSSRPLNDPHLAVPLLERTLARVEAGQLIAPDEFEREKVSKLKLSLVQRLVDIGMYEKAERICISALQQTKESDRPLFWSALAHFVTILDRTHRSEEAIAHANVALTSALKNGEITPTIAALSIVVGEMVAERNEPSARDYLTDAISYFESHYKLLSNDEERSDTTQLLSRAYEIWGDIETKLGDWEDATYAYETSLEWGTSHRSLTSASQGRILLKCGRVQLINGAPVSAIQSLAQASILWQNMGEEGQHRDALTAEVLLSSIEIMSGDLLRGERRLRATLEKEREMYGGVEAFVCREELFKFLALLRYYHGELGNEAKGVILIAQKIWPSIGESLTPAPE